MRIDATTNQVDRILTRDLPVAGTRCACEVSSLILA